MKEIFVVGLGAGSFSQLTLETWELLNSAELIFTHGQASHGGTVAGPGHPISNF